MKNKEDADFATALLLIAVAIYVAVIAALYAGMAVTKPTAAEAIAQWAKDYGSLVAGVPVLVAVWIAKEQLDANRKQHSATVKLQFRDELEGLQVAREIARSYRYEQWFYSAFWGQRGITKSDMEAVAKSGSPAVIAAFDMLERVVNHGDRYSANKRKSLLDPGFLLGAIGDDKTRAAEDLAVEVDKRMGFLRQFMPDL